MTAPSLRDPHCTLCNHDLHRCPGCGVPLEHGVAACPQCRGGTTAAEALGYVAGVLGEWLPGYISSAGNGPQRRIRLVSLEVTDGRAVAGIRAEGARGTGEPDRYFRIALAVAEIPAPEED